MPRPTNRNPGAQLQSNPTLRIWRIARLCFVATAIAVTSAGAQVPSLVQNPHARDGIDLDGKWNVIVDPFETGFYNYRYQPDPNGYYRDRKMENPWDLVEYNFETGPTLDVPGDWNSQDDRLFFYEGTVWYKKTFVLEPDSSARYFVYFGAANYDSHVYLNGKAYLGQHVGGFTPFNFEVTEHLVSGENAIIVKVDNKRLRTGVPTVNTDWWNYGGITRSVKLVAVPETFIRDYFVHLSTDSADRIVAEAQLDGEASGVDVTIEIPELGVSTSNVTNESGSVKFEIDASPELWSPESPILYDVTLRTTSDTVTDQIGFRTIETRGTEILLNGNPVFLRGVSIHEESPFGDGRAYSEEDAEVLLGWAKEMNCNFVRLAHYPHNEHMLRVADRMGLMVWSEIPVYWTVQFENPDVLALAGQQLQEMISRDHNRASIVLWSVANETPESDARLEFLTELANQVRAKDPTRLVTAALDTQSYLENGIAIDDPFGEVIDVIGVNSYCGWYGNSLPQDCADIRWYSDYGKPVVFSEFGGGALQGLHGSHLDRWTEEYQASVYEHNLKMLDQITFLAGTSPWILKDFRSPRRPLPDIQDYWNRKGLISDRGIRKAAFYLMQDWYSVKGYN